MNLLKHPLSRDFGQDFSIVQYVDDTLIILLAEVVQLMTLKGLLRTFLDSTTLRVNYNKSFLVPINISKDKALHLANTIGCEVAAMPFTYLGLPLGTTRPSINVFLTFLSIIERRMMGLNKLINY
jgi:hypothetical protein